ncbi:MAG TPA: hypothetical protein VGD65_04720 [Chryseosolibacter sp.]
MRSLTFLIVLGMATSCAYYSEQDHPEEYIKIVCEPWTGESLLELEIINTASKTSYRNIALSVIYLENGRKVGAEQIVHWGTIEPQSNAVLRAKICPPRPPVRADEIQFEICAHPL